MYKIKKSVISFDYDNILATPIIGSKREDLKTVADCLLVERHVREWYTEEFPGDPMGKQITGDLSWYDLLERMRCGEDIYRVLGVLDSRIRERVMAHLAKLLNVPYDVVYELWLKNERNLLWGMYDEGRLVSEERLVTFKRYAISNAHNLERMIHRLTEEELEQVKRLATALLQKREAKALFGEQAA